MLPRLLFLECLDALDIWGKLCYNTLTQKNNADHPASVGDRICRLTAVFGDKETRCKSVATAIAVMSFLALSRNAYRSVPDKKLLGNWGASAGGMDTAGYPFSSWYGTPWRVLLFYPCCVKKHERKFS